MFDNAPYSPLLFLLLAMVMFTLGIRTFPAQPALLPLPVPAFQSTAASPTVPTTPFDREICSAADKYRLDPLLIKAIISVESEFDPHCVSPKGARGLMQLLPGTARRLAIKNIFDPQENITGGARHFRYLLSAFSNNLSLSLAAYNAGERPVLRYKGIPPYEETQRYVKKVLKVYASYRSQAIS